MTVAQEDPFEKCQALVLAAGKGMRMKSDLPKAAYPLAGEPLLSYVLGHLADAGIGGIVLVVGYGKEKVLEVMRACQRDGLHFQVAEQTEQLGTAHAVLSAREILAGYTGPLMVTNGDMPMIGKETFRRLLQEHIERNYFATVLSARVEVPFGYGRLIREQSGELLKIVEEKDASEEEKKIDEVNTGTYVFQSPDIFDVLSGIDSNNQQKEYYLPDAVSLLRGQGHRVGSLVLDDPTEAQGVNMPEELKILEERIAGEIKGGVRD